ncbi:glycosyltransferase family 39 protein [Geobacter sp. AOG2]|uniref:glycosyltransferase family 39 protein n=1 Tax=Geobacter sp. AOG2 TaxID=1566347 RepID=UPI001CC4F7E3|nr:glycosyltransferase family 39 protein [Geobacter sp. AOG2]GFE62160.1 hypothetical protein AOG2_27480 [Geobacter sp. AOG2]
MLYFGLRLLFLATTISPFIPPDEVTHFGICTIFSTVPFLPKNSPESYQYGLVTNIPWLYYWIMGKLLTVNFFGVSDLVFLRLLNIPLAFAFVFYVWRTLRLVTDHRLTQILLVVATTNTMMLTFLSAFVSYDNLANLLAAMAVYYLLAFFKNRSPGALVASFVCQLAGCLTKITFLPLIPVLNAVLIIHEIKKIPGLPSALVAFYRASGLRGTIVTLVLLLGLALNIQLYAGNYLHYGAITVEMTTVLPLEDAMQYRLAARSYVFDAFKEGRVSKAQALAMTSLIKHPGDRADAVFMIENYERFKNGEIPKMGLSAYIPLWVGRMAAGTFGVFAHLQILNRWPTIAPIAFLAAITLIAFLTRWRPRDAEWLPTSLLVIAGFYTYFLMYQFNYHEYLSNGAPFVALHGRYIFPVLGPIYILSSFYLLRLFKGRGAQLAVFGLAAFIFIISDFPLFCARITPDWSYWPPN